MRFDFFDLQLLLHIIATGSLTKGAERSAISLQAASERIKKLEQYFNTPYLLDKQLALSSPVRVML